VIESLSSCCFVPSQVDTRYSPIPVLD